MKKLNVGIMVCGLMTLTSYLYAAPPGPPAPPGSHVKKATIHLEQGENIFANGRMQAVARVNYELQSGVTLRTITLQEFGTGVDIASFGWQVTQTDNMYDHNISSNGRSRTGAHNNHSGDYEKYYISTENAGENVEICVELRTEKNGATDVWSSCEDAGIQDGRISISALRPKTYSPGQFNITREGFRTNDPSVSGLEVIRVNPIGFSMKFISVNFVPNGGVWMPDGLDFVGRYGKRKKHWLVGQNMFWNAQLYYVHSDAEQLETRLYGYNYWIDAEYTLIHLTTNMNPHGMTFINTWSSVYYVAGSTYVGWDLDPRHPRVKSDTISGPLFAGEAPRYGYPTGFGKVLAHDMYGNPINLTFTLNTSSLRYSISVW